MKKKPPIRSTTAIARAVAKAVMPNRHGIFRCPYCMRSAGTVSIDIDAALAVRSKRGAIEGSKLLVYGFRDAAGKTGCCSHVLSLGIDLEMTGTPHHDWLAEDAARYVHPLITAHRIACGQSCGLWDQILENVCESRDPEAAERWAEPLQQPFQYIDATKTIAGDGWVLEARWWALVALDPGALFQEVGEMLIHVNPGFRPCLLTVPGGRDSLQYYLPVEDNTFPIKNANE